jgi:hypothetical protein
MLIRIPAKRTYATSRELPCHFKEIHGHLNCRYDGRGGGYARRRLLEVTGGGQQWIKRHRRSHP